MTKMSLYYISRAFISLALGGLFALTGSRWWMSVLVSVIAFAFFLWAPHSKRYTVHPEHSVTSLRRDERTQAINNKAARNAFVVTILAVAATAIYFGTIAPADAPVFFLNLTLALGMLTYFVSDFWLRRT